MKRINKILRWINQHELLCSITMVVVVALITFLPSVKNAGFYIDDYHMVFAGNNSGPDKIRVSYMVDRPAAGYLLGGLYQLFGPNIHYYQALVILLNISVSLSILWLIRKVWPTHKAIAFTCAILAVVYPGFVDSMHSFNYSMILFAYSCYIFSIALTIKAILSSRRLTRYSLVVISALLSLASMLLIEYYLGLEILRIGLIYLIIGREFGGIGQKKQVLNKTLKLYIPYLVTAVVFCIWRFFIFSSFRSATHLGGFIASSIDSPFYKIVAILLDLLGNFLKITLFAWFEPVYRQINNLSLQNLLFCIIVGLIGAIMVYVIYKKLHQNSGDIAENKEESSQFFLLGVLTVIGTSLPIVFVSREVTFSEYGRYTLSGMLGGLLIFTALIHFFVKRGFRPFIISSLVFFGIVTQLGVGKSLAEDWSASKDLWWQLSWRAPSLRAGTVLTGVFENYQIREGFNLWGPANMIYYPTEGNVTIAAETLNPDFIKTIQMNQNTERNFRSYIIYLKPENLLVLSVPSEVSCLHLINGAAPDYSIYETSAIQLVGQYSRLDQVDVEAYPMSPPTNIFGEEPAHSWCYFYQKAELALQSSDYPEVARLRKEAESQGLRPDDHIELLPFILAYAELEDTEKLTELLPMFLDDPYHKVNYCNNLTEGNYNVGDKAHRLLIELSCKE